MARKINLLRPLTMFKAGMCELFKKKECRSIFSTFPTSHTVSLLLEQEFRTVAYVGKGKQVPGSWVRAAVPAY